MEQVRKLRSKVELPYLGGQNFNIKLALSLGHAKTSEAFLPSKMFVYPPFKIGKNTSTRVPERCPKVISARS